MSFFNLFFLSFFFLSLSSFLIIFFIFSFPSNESFFFVFSFLLIQFHLPCFVFYFPFSLTPYLFSFASPFPFFAFSLLSLFRLYPLFFIYSFLSFFSLPFPSSVSFLVNHIYPFLSFSPFLSPSIFQLTLPFFSLLSSLPFPSTFHPSIFHFSLTPYLHTNLRNFTNLKIVFLNICFS